MGYWPELDTQSVAFTELPTTRDRAPNPAAIERPSGEFSRSALSILASQTDPNDKLLQLRDLYAGSSWEPGTDQLLSDTAQKVKIEGGVPLVPDESFEAFASNSRSQLPNLATNYWPTQRDQGIDDWATNVKAEMRAKGGVNYLLSAKENDAYVDLLSQSWKREGNVSSSPTEDYIRRFAGGAVDAAASFVGASPDAASNISDPRYDDDHLASLMNGLGNGVVSVGATIAAGGAGGLIAKAAGWSGRLGQTAGILVGAFGGSAAQNYSSAWETVYKQTGSREAATSAALNTWPSWALDGISTLVEAKGLTKFAGPTRAAKIEGLTQTIMGSSAEAAVTAGVLGAGRSYINQSAEAPFIGGAPSVERAFEEGLGAAEVGGILGGATAALGRLRGGVTEAPVEPPPEALSEPSQGPGEEPPAAPPSGEALDSAVTASSFSPAAAELAALAPHGMPELRAEGETQPTTPEPEAGPPLYRVPQVIDTMRAMQKQASPLSEVREGSLETAAPDSGALGHFEPLTGLMRTKEIGKIDVVAHEVAHGLSSTLFSPEIPKDVKGLVDLVKNGWANQKLAPEVEQELVSLGQRIYPPAKYPNGPSNGWVDEGFAELARMKMTGNKWPVTTMNDNGKSSEGILGGVPNAVEWFDKTALPQIAKNIDARRELYSAAGDNNRVVEAIRSKRPIEKLLAQTSGEQFTKLFTDAQTQGRGYFQQTLAQKSAAQEERGILAETRLNKVQKGLKDMVDGDLYFQYIDRIKPLENLQKLGEDIRGGPLPENARPYDQVVALFSEPIANSRAWLTGTPVRLGTTIRAHGENFSQILSSFTGKPEDFSTWARGIRAQYYHVLADATREMVAQNLVNQGTDPLVIQKTLEQLPTKDPGITLEAARNDIRLSEEKFPELKDIRGRLEAWDAARLESARGLSKSGDSRIDAIQGEQQIVKQHSPDTSTIYFPLFRVVDESLRGNPAKGQQGSQRPIQPVFENLPLAMLRWNDHLLRSQAIESLVNLGETVPGFGRFITKLGAKPDGVDINTNEEFAAPVVTDKNDKFTYFRTTRLETDDLTGGKSLKSTWYEVDKKIAAAYKLGDYTLVNSFTQSQLFEYAFRKPKQFTQAGAIGLRPDWIVGTGVLRALGEVYYLRGENDGTLREALGSYFGLMGRSMLDAVSVAQGKAPDPIIERFRDLGLARQLETYTPTNLKESEKLVGALGGKFDNVSTVKNWTQAGLQILAAPELAKKGAAMLLREKALYGSVDPNREYTQAEKIELLKSFRDMSGDHMRTGNAKSAQFMGMITPFLQGQLQGTAKIAEAMRTPIFWQRAMGMSVAAGLLTLWHRTEDKEWWDEIPDGQKYKYWFINPPGTKTMIRIPKAFQLDFPTSTVEALIDSMGPDGANRVKGELLDGLRYDTFGMATLAGAPVVKALANQLLDADIKTDSPIETAAMLGKVRPERFNEYTTETAKTVGKIFDASPARIEKAVTDLGGYSVLATTKAIEGLVGVRHLPPGASSDLTLFSGLFPQKGIEIPNSKTIGKFYDNLSEISFKSVLDTPEDKALRAQMRNAGTAIGMLNQTLKQLDVSDARREPIYKLRLDIARRANAALESRTVSPGGFRQEQAQAEEKRNQLAAPPPSP